MIVCVWEREGGEGREWINELIFTPHGKKLITVGHPNSMYIANVQTHEMEVTLHATGY